MTGDDLAPTFGFAILKLKAAMKYHLNRKGVDLGLFSLEELRRKRQSGELDGTELVWCQGMANWQMLEIILSPPRLRPKKTRSKIIVPAILAGLVLFIGGLIAIGYLIRNVQEQLQANSFLSDEEGLDLAGPIPLAADTLTATDVNKQARELRLRHYLVGYQRDGQRDHACDTDSVTYIRAWIALHFGGEAPEMTLSFEELGEKIADSDCHDPLLLAITAMHRSDQQQRIERLERAQEGLEQSNHKPYPRFWITTALGSQLRDQPARTAALDAAAVRLLGQALNDGSLPPEDQHAIAESLVHGWASGLFKRQAAKICAVVQNAGAGFEWLSLVLDGEHHVIRGWQTRGNGFANTVSRTEFMGFREHMAAARASFTQAWELYPEDPITASRMIYVAMGESNQQDMRLWFERAVTVQIDNPGAWARMRWALRPRWHGSVEAMRAFGISAVDTGRFDTDVPRKFFDVVSDLESELKIPDGEYLYGRKDIWPHLQRMYEGYIAEPTQSGSQGGWRSAYAGVAFLAENYDIAREQLEELQWEPWPASLAWWELDGHLMALEVAARTGAHREQVTEAERALEQRKQSTAAGLYREILKDNPDERTLNFVRHRLEALESS